MSPGQWLLVWFLGLVAMGTLALMLPGMTVLGGISAIDALFTATTAVSVTGLMVVDIEQAFTPWGRVVILVLVQLGGIGIITFASILILTTARKLSVSYEDMLGATLASSRALSVRQVAFAVVRFTILIEVIGTLALFVLWPGDGPWPERLWSATFHAISAFCNAGISLYSNNLKEVADSSGVVMGMALLIVLGGFGFTNFLELLNRWRKGTFRWSHFSLFLKVSIVLTVALNVFATTIFLIVESDIAFQGKSLGDTIVAAFFHAVTTRTAGFDIVPVTAFSDLSLRFMMLLMFIGAVSGSCAGGIKLSTLAVLAGMVRAHVRNNSEPLLFNRRLSRVDQNKAVVLAVASITAVALGLAALTLTEGVLIAHNDVEQSTLPLEFEVFSALGTVGLSLGVTSHLTTAGKAIIIGLMICGRLGPLALISAWVHNPKPTPFTNPEESLTIG